MLNKIVLKFVKNCFDKVGGAVSGLLVMSLVFSSQAVACYCNSSGDMVDCGNNTQRYCAYGYPNSSSATCGAGGCSGNSSDTECYCLYESESV